ncbi:MAG: hypothetical protein R3Y63_13185, partial [Eubacteriales bacterium]
MSEGVDSTRPTIPSEFFSRGRGKRGEIHDFLKNALKWGYFLLIKKEQEKARCCWHLADTAFGRADRRNGGKTKGFSGITHFLAKR